MIMIVIEVCRMQIISKIENDLLESRRFFTVVSRGLET